MNKALALAVLSGIIAACNTAGDTTSKEQPKPNSEIHKTQMDNQEIEYNGTKMWVGEINEEAFHNGNYSWYDQEYNLYKVNQEIIDQFKSDLQKIDIQVFMGTWCGDSQRETPAFFKIMQAANYPDRRIHLYALDRSKNSPAGFEDDKDVQYVPTFIFYKNGTEIGRIVESPINSLEEDILDIVQGTPQTHNYAE